MRGDRLLVHAQRILAVLALAVVMALSGGTAGAGASPRTVIQVFPGADAISNALQQANPGDTLAIHTGTYAETVSVNVARVTLRAFGDGPVTVDGQCQDTTIDVNADGVQIDGLSVIGGDFFDVNFMFVSTGRVSNSRLKRTCPDTEYGINLFQDGPMLIDGNTATGFTDAGIYIGGIVDTGAGSIVAKGNELRGNNRGIIVEDSFGVSLKVTGNLARHNQDDGIFLHNSDGIVVTGNTTTDNGFDGIELDPDSDANLVSRNSSRDNAQVDLANGGGTGNCFVNNRYETSSGSITC